MNANISKKCFVIFWYIVVLREKEVFCVGKLRIILFSLILYVSCFFSLHSSATAQFKDVASDRFSAQAINKMVELEIVKGYEDGTFRPANYITRAELAKIVAIFQTSNNKLTVEKYLDLVDVPQTHWAANSINFLVQNKYMELASDKTFAPNRNVTRGEFAVVLSKTRKFEVPASYQINFTDVPKSSPYYESVRALTYYKITSGTSATKFSPDLPLTREQIAVFFDRLGELDKGLALTKKIDFSKYYTKGEKLLSPAKFEEMLKPAKGRWLKVYPIADDSLPFYIYNYKIDKFEFTPASKDGEYFYYITYGGWGSYSMDEFLVKLKFSEGKLAGYKLYTEKEVKTLKETIFKSDSLFNEFVLKNNLDHNNLWRYENFEVSHFMRYDGEGNPTYYYKPKFEKEGIYEVIIPNQNILLEFNVVEENGKLSYTFKELKGDFFAPVAETDYSIQSNSETIDETDFIKWSGQGYHIFNPKPNTIPEGTRIVFYGDIPKVFIYLNGTITELEPHKFLTEGKEAHSTAYSLPEGSNLSYAQYEILIGKDAIYFYDDPVNPFPIGGIVSYYLGEDEYYEYEFTGKGFVEVK